MSIDALSIACPKCGAKAGFQCSGARGQIRSALHQARHKDATDQAHAMRRQIEIDRAVDREQQAALKLKDAIETLATLICGDISFITLGYVQGELEQAVVRRLPFRRPAFVPKKEKIGYSLRRAVFERDAYRCVTCGDHRDLTCDHIHPESKGGETSLDNLQTMCRSCNSRKGARL